MVGIYWNTVCWAFIGIQYGGYLFLSLSLKGKIELLKQGHILLYRLKATSSTPRYTHTHMHSRTHAHSPTHARTQQNKEHTHTRTHSLTHTHACTHTHSKTNGTCTHTHTLAHTLTNTAKQMAHTHSRTHSKTKGLEKEQRLVYQMIEDSGSKGIWMREIRVKSNIAQSELTRCLKTLESKKLIKSVRSVQAARRKVCSFSFPLPQKKRFSRKHSVSVVTAV